MHSVPHLQVDGPNAEQSSMAEDFMVQNTSKLNTVIERTIFSNSASQKKNISKNVILFRKKISDLLDQLMFH